MSTVIRTAAVEDAAAISGLMLGEAHRITLRPDGRGAEAILASMREPAVLANIASDRFTWWIAERNGAAQGLISLRDNAHLYQMFVMSALHGQGIGRRLWLHLLSTMTPTHLPKTITVNASAFGAPFYRKLGFVATGPRIETCGIAFVPMSFDFFSPALSSVSTSS